MAGQAFWEDINRQEKVRKVYIETYRGGVIAADALIERKDRRL